MDGLRAHASVVEELGEILEAECIKVIFLVLHTSIQPNSATWSRNIFTSEKNKPRNHKTPGGEKDANIKVVQDALWNLQDNNTDCLLFSFPASGPGVQRRIF